MKLFIGCVLAASAFAVATQAVAADSDWSSVIQLKAWSSSVDIVAPGGHHSCGFASNTFRLYPSTNGHDEMFKLATSALLAGREVNIQYQCSGQYASVTAVRLR